MPAKLKQVACRVAASATISGGIKSSSSKCFRLEMLGRGADLCDACISQGSAVVEEYEGVQLHRGSASHLGVAMPGVEVVDHGLEARSISHGRRQGGQIKGGSQHSVHQDISIPARALLSSSAPQQVMSAEVDWDQPTIMCTSAQVLKLCQEAKWHACSPANG